MVAPPEGSGRVSNVDRSRHAAAAYVASLDPQRSIHDIVPVTPRAAPRPTRSLRIKMGELVGRPAMGAPYATMRSGSEPWVLEKWEQYRIVVVLV